MSNLSDFYGSAGGGGGTSEFNKNPVAMGGILSSYSQLCIYGANSTTANVSDSTAFWTDLDTLGAYVAGASVADTYETLVDINNSGYLCNVISGVLNAIGDVTVRYTIDGVVKEITRVGIQANNQRYVAGPVRGFSSASVHIDDPVNLLDSYFFRSHLNDGRADLGQSQVLPSPVISKRDYRNSICRFEQSLKVEIKATQVVTTANVYWARRGVVYVID